MGITEEGFHLYGSNLLPLLHTNNSEENSIDLFSKGNNYLLKLIAKESEVHFSTTEGLENGGNYEAVFGINEKGINIYKKMFIGTNAYIEPAKEGFNIYVV